jgi:hypothetical protein
LCYHISNCRAALAAPAAAGAVAVSAAVAVVAGLAGAAAVVVVPGEAGDLVTVTGPMPVSFFGICYWAVDDQRFSIRASLP